MTLAEYFAHVWNASKSVTEASEKLGLTYGSAKSLASRYRNRGMNIKDLKSHE